MRKELLIIAAAALTIYVACAAMVSAKKTRRRAFVATVGYVLALRAGMVSDGLAIDADFGRGYALGILDAADMRKNVSYITEDTYFSMFDNLRYKRLE